MIFSFEIAYVFENPARMIRNMPKPSDAKPNHSLFHDKKLFYLQSQQSLTLQGLIIVLFGTKKSCT